ncbi:MAG: DNA primase [Flavobacteriales bacterium]|nr:MAG: DNA primase [Flavobacteriales bacterium]
MIPKQTIDEIFDAAIIEDVVGEFVPLKKRGANYLGNCPFHNEKTPSFTVSPAKGIYKCFGCGKAGNSVNFVMEHEHYSYPEALRFLAGKYSIEIEEEELTDDQKEAADERESLYIVSNYAANYFKKQLLESNEGKAIGLSYFLERGFREDIIEKFQLGYNPDGWTAFTDEAEKAGHNLKYLDKSGLTIVKGDKKFDRFKGRVMFPIHNLSGRVLGFGGRILKSTDKAAKYLNSPESEIYHKSKVLYGIFTAKKAITQEDICYLVEGYTDVISLYQSGVENVVSSSGTSLTEGQIRLIRRFTPNITILYDGDAAGLKASFRGIDMILQEGMNVRVVLFPEGEDPDSYAKSHTTEELKDYITTKAQDFIRFKTSVLIKDVGNDPIKKAELIKDIVASIAIIPDQIKRSVYTKECSSLLDIPEQALINETNNILRKNIAKQTKKSSSQFQHQEQEIPDDLFLPEEFQGQKEEKGSGDLQHWEKEIIRLLVSFGDQTIHVELTNEQDEKVKEEVSAAVYMIDNIIGDGIFFENKTYQKVFDFYNEKLKNDQLPSHQDFINNTDQEISQFVIGIFSTQHELSPNWEKHKIFTITEDQQLTLAVERTTLSFKLSKVEVLILEKQEEIKIEKSYDKQLELMKEEKAFQKIKIQLAAKLGRIILR